MIKVHILDKCPHCLGQSQVPMGEGNDYKGRTYTRYIPCPDCEGSGKQARWISLQEFAELLHQAACQHEHVSAQGGMHFSAGDVWDDALAKRMRTFCLPSSKRTIWSGVDSMKNSFYFSIAFGCIIEVNPEKEMITKTAATLTPSEISRFRRQLKARDISIPNLIQSRLARASQVAAQAASLLRDQFSARQVVVFGSVVTPELFHARSDIDLAVWGLDSRDYYRVVGVLQAIDPDFSIDLITYEEASPDLQAVIQRDGVIL